MALADFEVLADANNPTLKQANAFVRRSQEQARQAGLYPNPSVGYQGEQIRGGSYGGGEQGGFVQQTVVLGGKLGLLPGIYEQQTRSDQIGADSPTIKRAQQEAAVAQARLKDAKRESVPDLQLRAGEQYNGDMSERTQPRQPERRALPARASTFRFGTGTRATLEPRRLRSSAQNRMLLARSSPFGNRQLRWRNRIFPLNSRLTGTRRNSSRGQREPMSCTSRSIKTWRRPIRRCWYRNARSSSCRSVISWLSTMSGGAPSLCRTTH